jgi:hypothetical protein
MNGWGAATPRVPDTDDRAEVQTLPDAVRVPFCTRCHRIASHRQDTCCWCGAAELNTFTFDEISAHFSELMADWIAAGRQAECA